MSSLYVHAALEGISLISAKLAGSIYFNDMGPFQASVEALSDKGATVNTIKKIKRMTFVYDVEPSLAEDEDAETIVLDILKDKKVEEDSIAKIDVKGRYGFLLSITGKEADARMIQNQIDSLKNNTDFSIEYNGNSGYDTSAVYVYVKANSYYLAYNKLQAMLFKAKPSNNIPTVELSDKLVNESKKFTEKKEYPKTGPQTNFVELVTSHKDLLKGFLIQFNKAMNAYSNMVSGFDGKFDKDVTEPRVLKTTNAVLNGIRNAIYVKDLVRRNERAIASSFIENINEFKNLSNFSEEDMNELEKYSEEIERAKTSGKSKEEIKKDISAVKEKVGSLLERGFSGYVSINELFSKMQEKISSLKHYVTDVNESGLLEKAEEKKKMYEGVLKQYNSVHKSFINDAKTMIDAFIKDHPYEGTEEYLKLKKQLDKAESSRDINRIKNKIEEEKKEYNSNIAKGIMEKKLKEAVPFATEEDITERDSKNIDNPNFVQKTTTWRDYFNTLNNKLKSVKNESDEANTEISKYIKKDVDGEDKNNKDYSFFAHSGADDIVDIVKNSPGTDKTTNRSHVPEEFINTFLNKVTTNINDSAMSETDKEEVKKSVKKSVSSYRQYSQTKEYMEDLYKALEESGIARDFIEGETAFYGEVHSSDLPAFFASSLNAIKDPEERLKKAVVYSQKLYQLSSELIDMKADTFRQKYPGMSITNAKEKIHQYIDYVKKIENDARKEIEEIRKNNGSIPYFDKEVHREEINEVYPNLYELLQAVESGSLPMAEHNKKLNYLVDFINKEIERVESIDINSVKNLAKREQLKKKKHILPYLYKWLLNNQHNKKNVVDDTENIESIEISSVYPYIDKMMEEYDSLDLYGKRQRLTAINNAYVNEKEKAARIFNDKEKNKKESVLSRISVWIEEHLQQLKQDIQNSKGQQQI